MKHYRGNMLLIELVIVLLFFSLSQVVVVQVFAAAQKKAVDSRITHAALTMAQDVAERLSCVDEPEGLLNELGFAECDEAYVLTDGGGFELCAQVARTGQSAGVLKTVTLTATRGGEVLFAFPCATYEEARE